MNIRLDEDRSVPIDEAKGWMSKEEDYLVLMLEVIEKKGEPGRFSIEESP